MKLFLNDKLGDISYEINRAEHTKAIAILAHGAGAGMDHPFMTTLSRKLAESSVTIVRFNFPYMEQGKKSPRSPNEAIKAWKAMVDHTCSQFAGYPVFMAGKSYGGRMGSHMLTEGQVNPAIKGIIYFGFPLHAPGRDAKDRASHLSEITLPQLFIQGAKDKLANIEMMKEVVEELPKATIYVIEHADHSFNLPKSAGLTKEEVVDLLVNKSVHWVKEISA